MKSKFRIGRGVAEGLILLGVILITVSATFLKETPAQELLMYISLALLIIALFVVYFFCRCPGCGQVIFKNLIGAKICPDCGRPLWPGQKMRSQSAGGPRTIPTHHKKKR